MFYICAPTLVLANTPKQTNKQKLLIKNDKHPITTTTTNEIHEFSLCVFENQCQLMIMMITIIVAILTIVGKKIDDDDDKVMIKQHII